MLLNNVIAKLCYYWIIFLWDCIVYKWLILLMEVRTERVKRWWLLVTFLRKGTSSKFVFSIFIVFSYCWPPDWNYREINESYFGLDARRESIMARWRFLSYLSSCSRNSWGGYANGARAASGNFRYGFETPRKNACRRDFDLAAWKLHVRRSESNLLIDRCNKDKCIHY